MSERMGSLVCVLACIGLASCLNSRAPSRSLPPTRPNEGRAETVSVIQLIATPERFDGKRIRVTGYLNIQFEDMALYLHEEDCMQGIQKNAFWIELPNSLSQTPAGYVTVEAVLDPSRHGHLSAYQGTLTDVTSLDRNR